MNNQIQPVMSLNPYTDKLMNIEPLFDFLRLQSSIDKRVDEVIRVMTINLYNRETLENGVLLNEFQSCSDLFLFLYDIRDLFEKILECEISMPKNKGGKK